MLMWAGWRRCNRGDLLHSRESLTQSLALSRELHIASLAGEVQCELGLLSSAEAAALAGEARMAKLHEAVAQMERGLAIVSKLKQPQKVERSAKELVRLRGRVDAQ